MKKKLKEIFQMQEKELLELANTGNVEAMRNLGEFYRKKSKHFEGPAVGESISVEVFWEHLNDEGDPDFNAKAFKWFLKAAEAGDVESMIKVGGAFYDAIGVEQNYPKALEWYEKAATFGSIRAMNITAYLYTFSFGGFVPNAEKTFYWYSKAASLGNLQAIKELLKCYQSGEGTEKNEDKVDELFAKLPKKDASDIAYEISNKNDNNDKWLKIAIEMKNPSAIEKQAENFCWAGQFNEAIESFLKAVDAAKSGREKYSPDFFAEIYIRIGDIYYTGDNGEQNDELAFGYYQQAAEYNYNKAKMLLGRMYYLGRGTKKDLTTAYRYFWDVATGNDEFFQGICVNPSAFYLTGQMVESGEAGFQDIEMAIRAYKMSAKRGDCTESNYRLGDFYYMNGEFETALEYYEQAGQYTSNRKFFEGANKAAWMYELGEGVSVNYEKADEFWEKLPPECKPARGDLK